MKRLWLREGVMIDRLVAIDANVYIQRLSGFGRCSNSLARNLELYFFIKGFSRVDKRKITGCFEFVY
tara:strand:+ start:5268 stop:5468 length:201 start_codon:yes stop_codon:yes gene_type:complete